MQQDSPPTKCQYHYSPDPEKEADFLDWDKSWWILNPLHIEQLVGTNDYPGYPWREHILDLFLKLHEWQRIKYDRPQKAEINPQLRWLIWERDNFTCCQCGIRRDLTIDHIIPENKGGKATADNLQTLCRSCNSRKRTK